MIRKIGMTWQRLIMVMLFVTMLSASSWAGTAAAQATSNAQTNTNSATGTNAVTGTNSVSQVVYYSSKKVLADGGIAYTFNVKGVQNLVMVPPDGFSATLPNNI
jgi:hypothetical protein